MATEYKVRVYDRTGTLTHEISDFYSLAYSKRVNAPGILSFSVNGEHPVLAVIELDCRVEAWRRNATEGIAWYCDFYGLFRDAERSANESGALVATLHCPGILSLLGRRIVGYKAGTADKSTFSSKAAETIMISLLDTNTSTNALASAGRIRDGRPPWITPGAIAATGNVIDFNCAYQNLLEAMQDVAAVGGGDFDIAPGGLWNTYTFTWYLGQRGTNRAGEVVFSLDRGNMTNPVLRYNSLDERTVAIVGGQGEDSSRTVVVRTGANFEATYNDNEVFVDARQFSTTAGLEAQGDRALSAQQARISLEFDVIQTSGTTYGQEYFLGDLVTAVFAEYSATKKIAAVTVGFGLRGEAISVELSDV